MAWAARRTCGCGTWVISWLASAASVRAFNFNPTAMPTPDSTTQPPPARSALWRWGFWICFALACAALIVSLRTSDPFAQALRVASGALLIVGGIHNGRVVSYMRATRHPFSMLGFDAFLTQRQTGWSSIVLGIALVISAVVGL